MKLFLTSPYQPLHNRRTDQPDGSRGLLPAAVCLFQSFDSVALFELVSLLSVQYLIDFHSLWFPSFYRYLLSRNEWDGFALLTVTYSKSRGKGIRSVSSATPMFLDPHSPGTRRRGDAAQVARLEDGGGEQAVESDSQGCAGPQGHLQGCWLTAAFHSTAKGYKADVVKGKSALGKTEEMRHKLVQILPCLGNTLGQEIWNVYQERSLQIQCPRFWGFCLNITYVFMLKFFHWTYALNPHISVSIHI